MPKASNSIAKVGCFILVIAPLCVAGMVVLMIAMGAALTPPVNWLQVAGLTVLGLLFPLAAWAIFVARHKLDLAQMQETRRRELYPQKPWMWREDWSQGRVQSTTRQSMISTWTFALIWNLISSPILIFVPKSNASSGAIAVAMLFPLVGVYLLYLAIRLTLRWEKYGKTWFELGTLPGAVGKELRGTIHVQFPQLPENGVNLKLSCVNRVVTGSGKSRSVNEKILWRDESDLPSGRIQGGPNGSAIPVALKIPGDALETNTLNSNDSIIWCLQADAQTPGVDYQDIFEVPVFRAADCASEAAQPEQSGDIFPAGPQIVTLEKPLDAGIIVRPGMSGGMEYDFGVARNMGMAFGATVFFLILSAVLAYIILAKTAIIFPIVFGAFDALILVHVLNLWLGTSKLTMESGRLKLHKGLLGIGPTREIAFSDICGVTMPIGIQAGDRAGTPYYDIRLTLGDGREVAVAGAIRSKPEAEWLVARLKTEIGLKA